MMMDGFRRVGLDSSALGCEMEGRAKARPSWIDCVDGRLWFSWSGRESLLRRGRKNKQNAAWRYGTEQQSMYAVVAFALRLYLFSSGPHSVGRSTNWKDS